MLFTTRPASQPCTSNHHGGTVFGDRVRAPQCLSEFVGADFPDLSSKYRSEVGDQPLADLVHRNGAVEGALERRDTFIGNAARYHQVKVAQVGRNIVGKAVRRDPAAEMHAEGAELFVTRWSFDPHPMAAFDALGGGSEIGARAQHHFFELLDVPGDVPAVLR